MPKQPKDEQTGKLKPKFPVKIDTQDSEIKEMFEEYLPLITQQQEEELDKEQVGFLAEEAPTTSKPCSGPKATSTATSIFKTTAELYRQRHPWPAHQSRQRQRAILGDVLNDDNGRVLPKCDGKLGSRLDKPTTKVGGGPQHPSSARHT